MDTVDKIRVLIYFYGHKEAARRLGTTYQALSYIERAGRVENVGPYPSTVNRVYGQVQRRMPTIHNGEEVVVWGEARFVVGAPRMRALLFEDCYNWLLGIFGDAETAYDYAAITLTEGARWPYRAYIRD